MSTVSLDIENLLEPISPEQPVGTDLRWTPEWDRLKEARRSDDELQVGKWAKKDRKTSNWQLVHELATEMLRERTKDLQIAMWLTEADLKLYGFAGLRDGLKVSRELMIRYWDDGLFPSIEDGPEDRGGPFQWLNDKLTDAITAVPITSRSDDGGDYGILQLQEARRVGSEANCKNADGDIDQDKRKAYNKALDEGHISMEMFERAVKETRRANAEQLWDVFDQTHQEFRDFEKVIDQKFGDVAPSLSSCRAALNEIREELSRIVERKRIEEPSAPAHSTDAADTTSSATSAEASTPPAGRIRLPLTLSTTMAPGSRSGGASGSWCEAEVLIRSGDIERGLAEMTRLAASETSGRNRFQRKLLLAEICLTSGREGLARSILEELAEQIDKLQLEHWESTELIASVWTRLCKLYRKSGGSSSDADRAAKLYERLCRLDPWQALVCGES